MATSFDYYVRGYKKSDGTRAVQIRITHNRKNAYFPTSIFVTDRQLTKDMEIRDARIMDSIQKRLIAMRDAFLKIPFPEYLTIEELVARLEKEIRGPEKFRLDLFEYADRITLHKEPKTREGYVTSLNAVKRFIGGDRLDINEITTQWVIRFREFLENEPPVNNNGGKGRTPKKDGKYPKKSRGSRAVSYYLGCLRAIHNKARLEYNDYDTNDIKIPRQPFPKGSVPPMPITDHRNLSVADLHSLWVCEPTKKRERLAKDVFFLSFALAGTNTVDLYKLHPDDINGDLVTYRRSKTKNQRKDHAEITLRVVPMAREIIGRHLSHGKDHLLEFADLYSNSHEFNRAVNIGLKDLAVSAGLSVRLETYHARHSWGTIARNVLKVDFDNVNAALNHAPTGNDRVADIYIARDYSSIWAAQERMAKLIVENEKGVVKMSDAI